MYELKVAARGKLVTITSNRPIKLVSDKQLIANAKKSDAKITRDLHGNILQALCKCGCVFFPIEPCMCFGKVDRNHTKSRYHREKYKRKAGGQRTLSLQKIFTSMGREI